MPKVTEEHRRSRREQIITAALQCFAAKGFQHTSMADIIAASGLSAGAIYLQFEGKQQIMLAAGQQVLQRRLGILSETDGPLPDPVEALQRLVGGMIEDVPDSRLLVQLWGEAASDAQMASMVREIFGLLGDAWRGYLTDWARQRGLAEPSAWAAAAVPAILALAQGFLMQRALFSPFDSDAYFASVRTIVGSELTAG